MDGVGILGIMRASNKRVTLGLDCDASSADAFVDSMVTREILPCEKKHGPLTTRKVQPENERRTSRERPEHSKVRNRRQCRRGRSARAASTRAHPAAATRRSEAPSKSARSTPSKKFKQLLYCGLPRQRDSRLFRAPGPPGDQADDRLKKRVDAGRTPQRETRPVY